MVPALQLSFDQMSESEISEFTNWFNQILPVDTFKPAHILIRASFEEVAAASWVKSRQIG